MSLSPSKHRTLSRQPSSPSLAVGLPPALPESNIMQPSSPSKLAKSRSRKRIHRGDVSSSAASSDNEEEGLTQITPKRKIINPIEAPLPLSTGKKPKKKMTLQERLAAAASAKAGTSEGGIKAKVNSIADFSSFISEATQISESSSTSKVSMTPQTRSELLSSRSIASSSSSDKVVVCVRIKPTSHPFANIAYEISPTSLTLSDDHPKVKQRGGKAGREDGYTYTFDKLLQFPSTTPDLYGAKVAPLVDKAMNGFNSTIFAYGQTGSGKSFTMTGTADELGIIPCAIDGVFDAITADTERAFLLRVSYIEIYNETLRDLLNFKKGPLKDDEKPAIHYAKGKVYVDPLVEEIVSTPQDVIDLLEKGNAQRRVGATDWNERSSRSHCVFTIVVESRPRDGDGDDDIRLSRLNLIDLAGSEKAVSDSERRGEGKHINQSLLALREVINKLTEKTKASHVPYRNSKLTHLLENALGGDSNICVICTMSAEEEHCGETLETLKFAGRCSQVKTNAKKNVLQSSERALIKAKDQEIEDLRLRLATFTKKDVNPISDLAESVAAMEARKSKLVAQLSKLNGEILTSELPRSGSGLPLSPPKPKRRRISDFSAMISTGSGRTGIGLGTPKKTVDRRAISGMSRLTEESEEMAGIMGTLEQAAGGGVAKSFEQDRALAAARRNLATKEEELSLANRNLASALARASQLSERDAKISTLETELRQALDALSSTQQKLQRTESDMGDQNAQLESTRSEMVAKIEERSKRIDELENKVIDLRNSREELVLEDQGRLEEVQKRSEELSKEKEGLECTLKRLQHEALEQGGEVERLKGEIATLVDRGAETKAQTEISSLQIAQLEDSMTQLKKQLEENQYSQASREATLQTEKAIAERQVEEARADLDRFQREAMSNEANVLGQLRDEIGNLRKARDEDKLAFEKMRLELEREIEEGKERSKDELTQAKNEAEERERKLREQVAEALKTLQEAAKANDTLQQTIRLETESKATIQQEKADIVMKLVRATQDMEDIATSNKDLEERLQSALNIKTTLENERDEARNRLSASDGAADQLKSETNARQDAEVRLELAINKLHEMEDRLGAMQKDLEVQEKRLEAEAASRQDAENRIQDIALARDQAVAAEREKEKAADEEKKCRIAAEKRIEELSMQREANLEGVKEMRRKMDLESSSRKEVEAELEKLKARQSAENSGQDKLRAKLLETINAKEELSRQLSELVQSVKKKDEELRSVLATRNDMSNTIANLEEVHKALVEQNEKAESCLKTAENKIATHSALERSVLDLRHQLEAERTGRIAAESQVTKVSQELITKHESAQQVLENELISLRQALKVAQKEKSDAQSEAELERVKADELCSELNELKSRSEVTITTSVSSRLRHSAPGPGWGTDKDMSATALDSLRSRRGVSAGTHVLDASLSMLKARDDDEIERLERIIEVQKEIIDEQREKIERWAKEMEKQREIVRLLTNDNSQPSPIPARTRSPRGHGKSHSISHSPAPTPLPNAKGLVSSFTARNLALPTSPSPLPMHPSQFTNSSARKARRVTIEHDMDKLTESSKVIKAKAIFESPEKNAAPATPPKIPLRATQSIRSVPRQRRP
ncbi:uncharacterized protein I206_104093 [Kwoniella pini CBS 10737]|uniref:Kinesin motor domain-containing protein n=1 Tax=Kwoniella pini CBS 10737 TaxID=1296096 RepID=A0AAJ8MPY7_9TREE